MHRSIEEYDALLERYRFMQLSVGASSSAIKRRYRQLAKRWHPDKFEGRPRRKGLRDHFRARRIIFPRFSSVDVYTYINFLNRMKEASRARDASAR